MYMQISIVQKLPTPLNGSYLFYSVAYYSTCPRIPFQKKKNMRYDHLVEIVSIFNYLSGNEGSQNLNHTVTTIILTYKLFKIKFYVIIFDMHVLFVTDCGSSNMFFKCLIQNINRFQMTQYRIFQKTI